MVGVRGHSSFRTRWAAIGAAVAVSLGAGGLGISHAVTGSGTRAVYRPLASPCRLADLRPAPFRVGPRSAPLGADETYVLSGWGAVGNCILPSGTTALQLNVTALGATQATFLRFWPADGTPPGTANLNPTPGQPPTPNAVTVGLGPAGTFKVFNKFGSVNVVIDVVGVYDHHHHDDRYYTEAESDVAHDDLRPRYAKVDADTTDATLIRGRGVESVSRIGLGIFQVEFDAPIDSCGWVATRNDNADGVASAGEAAVEMASASTPNLLWVRTFDSSGTAADPSSSDGFTVHVIC